MIAIDDTRRLSLQVIQKATNDNWLNILYIP